MVAIFGIILIVFIMISGLFLPKGSNWIAVLIFMILFFALIGSAKGKWYGILVDERNEVSLSRFQVAIWTLIVLSAFLTIALSRIAASGFGSLDDALTIAIPWQLWALLGISTASLVGSPLILSQKKNQTMDEEKAKSEYNITKKEDNVGAVFIAEKPEFVNIFTGDELADKDRINMAKVQMFFFTIIAAFSYAVLIFKLISTSPDPTAITAFPALPEALIAILGISHAGYLTEKAVPTTPELKPEENKPNESQESKLQEEEAKTNEKQGSDLQ